MQLGPKGNLEIYNRRRQKLLEKIKDGVAIFFAHPEQIRNNDAHHKYRQDSTFYYLTGFTEPESVIVLDGKTSKFSLFVREKDATRELWDGFRYGLDGTKKFFGPDQVFSIKDLASKLPELIKESQRVYYRYGDHREHDEVVLESMQAARRAKGRSGLGFPDLIDGNSIVGEMRLIKSDDEADLLRKAGHITSMGHIAGMKATRPGMFEYELEAIIESEFRRLGSERLGYNSIVGTGANATVLHYVFNDDKLAENQLVLVDAGAEYGYYTGDITRTYPTNGKFTAAQKKLYEGVLKVQKECVSFVKPGIRLADIHNKSIHGLIDVMLDLGLLKGSAQEIFEKKTFTKYFPHGTSHWLGMDVHDSGIYQIDGQSRLLEKGMCFSVEPGLYVPQDDSSAPSEFRGIGIRIEDDILVTANGYENLTKDAPKEVNEIEDLVGSSV